MTQRLTIIASSLTILATLAFVGPLHAETCPDGRCPIPQWQPPIAKTKRPLPRLRTASCRINHRTGRGRSWGSGTLLQTDGGEIVVLTCAHLFRDGKGQTTVWFANGQTAAATIIGTDTINDLAALSVLLPLSATNAPRDGAALFPVTLATEEPQFGDTLTSCGFGSRGQYRSQAGAVIAFARSGSSSSANTVVFAGAARQGDSGGGVFNERGQLVAVTWGTDQARTMATTTTCIRGFLRRLAGRLRPDRSRQRQFRPNQHQPTQIRPLAPIPNRSDNPQLAPEQDDTFDRAHDKAADLLALANRLDELQRRLETNESAAQRSAKQSTQRLDSITAALGVIRQKFNRGQPITQGAAATTVVSPLEWLLPVVLGALGISAPPSAAILALKIFRCWARRRFSKRRRKLRERHNQRRDRSADSPPLASNAPRTTAQPIARNYQHAQSLNDDYAQQLNSLMEYSGGRTATQDATLGREYDRELRQAASQSGQPEIVQFANKLLDRVTQRFGRIHADNPVPAEPAAT